MSPATVLFYRFSPFRAAYGAVAIAVLAFLLAPILIVVLASFNDAQVLSFPIQSFSLRWYAAFLKDFELIESLKVSLVVAAVATVASLALGVPAAFSIARYSFPGRNAVSAFLLSPLLIPLVALGLAVLLVYAMIGVRPSLTGFILMHILITVPYVIRTVLAVLTQINPALEEAALSLGADDFRTKWYITLPLLRPGLIAGGFFAFMTSLDNVPVSVFLGSSRMTTLPVRIYSQIESYGIDPVFAAISTVIIAATLLIMIMLDRLIGLDHLK